MRIDILCNDGSPIGVVPSTIWGDGYRVGVGGAELALLTMCELWAGQGHEVNLYNSPMGSPNGFNQYHVHSFQPFKPRDVLIIFRSPNTQAVHAKGKKIWWSCDQYTVGNFRDFSSKIDEIVLISPRHEQYFRDQLNITEKLNVIPLPLRVGDYDDRPTEKTRGQCLFSSVPDRGLNNLFQMWRRIKERAPHAHLVVTSDYRLWGSSAGNQRYMATANHLPDVTMMGAVPRSQLLNVQLASEILAYPCTYDELFCYAVAEAAFSKAFPITSDNGSLGTTNVGEGLIPMKALESGFQEEFIEKVVFYLSNPEPLSQHSDEARKKILEMSHPQKVLDQWKGVFS